MDYSLRELECFLAVAEELSFTRAARRLHLAQPPLSRHIRVLEEKVGAKLFLRGSRGVSLTVAGDLFYEETRMIPARLLAAGDAARRAAAGEVGRLRLGFVSAVMSERVAGVMRRFREVEPRVQVVLQDMPPIEQIRGVIEGRLDGGFVGIEQPAAREGVEVLPWYRESLRCLVPVGHRLAERSKVAVGELRGEAFVAVADEAAPEFGRLVRRLCGDAGFRPQVVMESARAQAVVVMVAAGSGIAILPEALEKVAGAGVVALPIQEKPVITHLFARRAGGGNPLLRGFVRILQKRLV